MKFCETCGEMKPYHPAEKRQSKAMGFVGHACWDCFKVAQRTKMRGRMGLGGSATPITYGALVLKAQSVLDKLLTEEPLNEFKINQARYLLQRAQHKVTMFGPGAFDFVAPKEKAHGEYDETPTTESIV